MDRFLMHVLVCTALVVSMIVLSSAQTCSKYAFAGNKMFSSCTDLPYLNSSLHWTYDSSTNTAQIAYRHTAVDTSKWVAWAINPNSTGMVGAQALVAYKQSDGTMKAYTSPISGYQTQLQEGDLSFNVSHLSATYAGNEIIIFATIVPPDNGAVNQVWQEGPLSGGSPSAHTTTGANVKSMGTLNFASGQTGTSGGGNNETGKGNVSDSNTCSNYAFSGNKVFSSCTSLPYLNSFLHWTYDSSTNKVQIAYRHTSVDTSKWVAWAINPTSTGMVGAQALVAYQQSDGTMKAYTSPISGYQTQLQEGALSFNVSDLSATYASNEIIIFATIIPPSNGVVNQAGSSGGGNSKIRKRNTHGVLNAVSWGTLMPIGAIIARYLKVSKAADPAWFYLHVACQSSAYIVGVAGWATGLKLGSESPGITYTAHRTIGIVLFCLGTLQVFALLLRPKKDHKYRFYWNIYHHFMGYMVIVLSIVNIFKGFDILDPEKKWKDAYIGVIVALGCVAVVLEAFTWQVVLKRRRSQGGSKMPPGMNGSNGYNHNGYGARPHQEA
ncbi:hypothetical protein NL676_007614 [Syzygium grande]|nr:hypothetical protein NL676_007614 [Syzygium grande]